LSVSGRQLSGTPNASGVYDVEVTITDPEEAAPGSLVRGEGRADPTGRRHPGGRYGGAEGGGWEHGDL